MDSDSDKKMSWFDRIRFRPGSEDGPEESSSLSSSGGSFKPDAHGRGNHGFGLEDINPDRPLSTAERERLTASGLHVPAHIGIIMDGNGRWAQARGLPRSMGHRAGATKLRDITAAAARLGVKYLTVYAFSTENWGRPQSEVDQLMKLFTEYFTRYDKELAKEDVRLRFIGDIPGLPDQVRETIRYAEENSAERKGLHLIVAFNYGGRQEIIDAISKREEELLRAWRTGGSLEALDPESFSEYLYMPDVPDPDLVIRSSGELRSSNFLLWESAYAEYWVSDVLWPDFTGKHLLAAIIDFNQRSRRFGKVEPS